MISDEGDTSLNSGSQAQGDGDRSKLKQPSVFNEYKGDQKPEQAPLNPSLYGYDDYSKEFYGSTTSSFRNQTSSVLEDMTEGLALSMLVFLAADMRLLSATGSIGTKFESLAVESDFVIHNDKASCAVLNHAEEADTPQALPISIPTHVQQGLSPAHLMTIVLIEIRKTFKQQHRDQILNAKIKRHIGDAKNPEEAKAFTAFMLDKSKGKNKWEIDLSSLMKAHARMIGWDLNEKVPHIEARRSMLGFIGGNTDRRRASSVSMRQSIIAGLDYHRKELFDSTESKELNAMEEVTDALFNMAVATGTNGRAHNHRLRQSIKQTLSTSQPQQQTTNNTHFSLSSDDLLELMEKAVKSRKDDNLKFMANFFRSGTISQVMATSNIRVVWINDWFSQLDLMYAIAVDPLKKRVMVTFRCSITLNDWAKSLEYSHVHVENPVQDYYEGRKDLVCMHKVYNQNKFRVRKETGTTKYEEIVNVAHRYGLERIGEGYTLSVTGHSLGAALSTIFAFHASTDERFTRNGPIKMMTFASPYVGDHYFADAFRHQEEAGRVMAIRCYNHNDVVAYTPWNISITKRGSMYRHVGIGVRIPPVRWWCSWNPLVSYVGREGCLKAYARALKDNFLLNSAAVWNIKKMHDLGELQRRMAEGALRRRNNGGYDLLEKPIEELYKELVGVNLGTILPQRRTLQTEKKIV